MLFKYLPQVPSLRGILYCFNFCLEYYLYKIYKGDDDDCLASAKLDVIERDNNVIMADVNGPKLPPKPQPNVEEIKSLPAAECEDTAQDILPPPLPQCHKSGDM